MKTPVTLRDARTRRQWTQRQLAEAAGLSRVTISNIERGRTRPGPLAARRISAALGLPAVAIAECLPAPVGTSLGRRAVLTTSAPTVAPGQALPLTPNDRRWLRWAVDEAKAVRARSARLQRQAMPHATAGERLDLPPAASRRLRLSD